MPPMDVHADDKAQRIFAGVRFSLWRHAKVTASIVAVNTIEDFAFVEDDWFTLTVLPYVMLELVEILDIHRRECACKWVRFKRHHGFSHGLSLSRFEMLKRQPEVQSKLLDR